MIARKAGSRMRWTRSTISATAIGTRREARSMGRILVGCYSGVMRLLVALLLMPWSIVVPVRGADALVRIEGKNFVAARRQHHQPQGHQPRQLADARGLYVQVRGREVAAPDFRRLRPPSGTGARRVVLAAVPRHLHHPGRHQLHQVGRLQHGARAAALPAVHDGGRRDLGRGLGAARPRRRLGRARRGSM